MTYSQTVSSTGTDRERLRRSIMPAAAGVLVAVTALTVYGAHDFQEIAVVMGVLVAVMAGVYGFLVPRALDKESAGGTALTLSVLAALLLLPAFWSGLPLALGVAGAIIGYAGRQASSGSGKSIAGFVIGAVAAIGYFAVYLLDTLAQHGIG